MRVARKHPMFWAFVLHRASGLGLAVFLPFHFLVLGLAVRGEAELDGFLRWTESPLVKVAEMGLVFLLAVHLMGGLRLLALELLPWRGWQKSLAAASAGGAIIVAGLFLFSVV